MNEEQIVLVEEIGAINEPSKIGVKKFHASNPLMELLTKIRLDVNCSTKRRFNSDLIKGETFELKNNNLEKHNEQLKLFKANKAQLIKIDQFFMSKVHNDNLNESEHSVSDFHDIESLIATFHIVDSETATTKELQDLEYTASGKSGLNYKSPQFLECYIRILEMSLMTLDFNIATPIVVSIPDTNPYVVKLKQAIKELPELKNPNGTYADKGMIDRGFDIYDKELFNKNCNKFKSIPSDQEIETQLRNKEVISTLLNTVENLNNVKTNKKVADKCRKEIEEIIVSINKGSIKKKTTTDFIIHLLNNLTFTGYHIDEDKLKVIAEVKNNMKILNKSIADYHSYLRESENTVKGKYQYAAKAKLTLLKVAMSNYNLTKKYNKEV